MANKTTCVELLDEYFDTKGRVYNLAEYKLATDSPVRFQILLQHFGSWNRVERIMLARRHERAEVHNDVDEVLAARNAAELEAIEAAKAAKAALNEVPVEEEPVKEPVKEPTKPAPAATGAAAVK